MARYICTGVLRDETGAIITGATVTVYKADGVLAADVYAAEAGGVAVNSVDSDANGRFTFYADDATYGYDQEFKVVCTKTGYTTITIDDIRVYGVTAAQAAIAAVTPAANKVPYFTSATAASVTDLSAFARTVLDDADAATARATMEVTRSALGYSVMQAAAAANMRALLEISEFVSVVTYGAVGDNSTDDGPAFQAAHDALPATGGIIYIPKAPTSKYAIATKVTITKPCLIYGDGWGSIVRANGAIVAIFEVNDGGEGTTIRDLRLEGNKAAAAGTLLRGIEIDGATDCTVQNVLFSGPDVTHGLNFGVDIIGQASNRTKVLYCRFERLVSSSSNGTAILCEYSSHNKFIGNTIDSSGFIAADSSAGAAIFLSATVASGGIGSTHNLVALNYISAHPQPGISINSTTYYEFANQLGECSNNSLINNFITLIDAAGGGDASSGITVVGNSPRNKIIGNTVTYCGNATNGGYGIVVSASAEGTEEAGQPKMDESPSFTLIEGNNVEYNRDTGIRVNGALAPIVKNNNCYENGQRTANTFYNIQLVSIEADLDCENGIVSGNHCVGANPKYQIHIGANVTNAQLIHNYTPTGGTGTVLNEGTGTSTHP